MSEKLSIHVESVGLGVTHNFLVPNDMQVCKVQELIAKAFQEEYAGAMYQESENHYLLQKSSGKLVDPECNLKQMEITNGEKFIFI